jgi:hypothetical protein
MWTLPEQAWAYTGRTKAMIAAQEICAVRRNKSMKNQAAIDAQQRTLPGGRQNLEKQAQA